MSYGAASKPTNLLVEDAVSFFFFSVMELSFSSCCIACTHLSEPAFVILQKLASLYSISFFFFWEFHVMQFTASLLIIQYVWKFTETPWLGRLHPATVQSIGNIGCHWFHFFPALQTKFRNSVIQNFNPSISHYALTNRFSMYKLSSMDKNQTGPLMMFPRSLAVPRKSFGSFFETLHGECTKNCCQKEREKARWFVGMIEKPSK